MLTLFCEVLDCSFEISSVFLVLYAFGVCVCVKGKENTAKWGKKNTYKKMKKRQNVGRKEGIKSARYKKKMEEKKKEKRKTNYKNTERA